MKALSYNERLKHLNLESLQVRRLKNDLVLCYKMLHGLVDLKCSEFFMLSDCIHTRGHNYKLFKPQCSLDVRKYFFANRVVDSWNNLPSYIVSAPVFRHLKSCFTVMSLCLTICYIINFLLFVIWIQTHLVPVFFLFYFIFFLRFCGLWGCMLVLFVQPLHPVVLHCTINDIFVRTKFTCSFRAIFGLPTRNLITAANAT